MNKELNSAGNNLKDSNGESPKKIHAVLNILCKRKYIDWKK